jgi:hypothetical protein
VRTDAEGEPLERNGSTLRVRIVQALLEQAKTMVVGWCVRCSAAENMLAQVATCSHCRGFGLDSAVTARAGACPPTSECDARAGSTSCVERPSVEDSWDTTARRLLPAIPTTLIPVPSVADRFHP